MDINTEVLELIRKTRKEFRFRYVGGGYFRDKETPKGQKAEVRHGEEVSDEFCEQLIKRILN